MLDGDSSTDKQPESARVLVSALEKLRGDDCLTANRLRAARALAALRQICGHGSGGRRTALLASPR
jgi:hypothetical protein